MTCENTKSSLIGLSYEEDEAKRKSAGVNGFKEVGYFDNEASGEWRRKWDNLSVFFKYPEPIRKVIYTTNVIESVHRQFRKLTKTKGAFPNENSLLKLLYVGIQNISKKWTMPVHNWNLTLSQLAIYFNGRLDDVLDI